MNVSEFFARSKFRDFAKILQNFLPLKYCLADKNIYQAKVITEGNNLSNFYLGSGETPFKQSYRNHKTTFNKTSGKDSELSKCLWDLTNKNVNYETKWSKIKHTHGYNSGTKSCSLCLYEKLLFCEFQDTSRWTFGVRMFDLTQSSSNMWTTALT